MRRVGLVFGSFLTASFIACDLGRLPRNNASFSSLGITAVDNGFGLKTKPVILPLSSFWIPVGGFLPSLKVEEDILFKSSFLFFF